MKSNLTLDRAAEGRAVHQDNAATRHLAIALARKVETEQNLKKVGRTSAKPLTRLVSEAT